MSHKVMMLEGLVQRIIQKIKYPISYKKNYKEILKIEKERRKRVLSSVSFQETWLDSLLGSVIEEDLGQYVQQLHSEIIRKVESIEDFGTHPYKVILCSESNKSLKFIINQKSTIHCESFIELRKILSVYRGYQFIVWRRGVKVWIYKGDI